VSAVLQRGCHVGDGEQVTDEDVGAGSAARTRTFVVLPDERTHRVALFEQHVDHCSAHIADFAACTGDQNGSVLRHRCVLCLIGVCVDRVAGAAT
jgi:hypothetical protein